MKKTKILLISTSTGSGHVKTADALKKTAQNLYPDLDIEHIDMMDYVSLPLKKTILESYDLMAKRAPDLWGYFYKKTNSSKLAPYSDKMSNFFNQFNSAAFFRYILQNKPTHILCTMFLPLYAILSIQKKNDFDTKVSMLMTDYFSHDLQIAKNVQHYFVPTKKTEYHLTQCGVDVRNITISGIPIDPIFFTKKNLPSLKKKYGTNNDKTNLLILAGGQGLIDTSSIIKTLSKSNTNYRVFTIAGKNKKLESKLSQMKDINNVELHVIGWTDDMDEYMRIADYIITKPGGLTTTECITLEKPIIATSPIPGQEECNVEYILENNFGVVVRTPSDLLYYLENPKLWTKKIKKPVTTPAATIILNKLLQI